MSSRGIDSPLYDGARAAGEWRGTPSSAGAGRWFPPGPQGLAPLHLPQHTALQIQQRRHASSLSAQNTTHCISYAAGGVERWQNEGTFGGHYKRALLRKVGATKQLTSIHLSGRPLAVLTTAQ